jgi:hypothetical protein
MIGVCIAVDMAIRATLPLPEFTLAWTHSVEKIRWEEDYRVRRDGFTLTESRIRGAGAGMEPPAGSRLEGGVWRYRPAADFHPRLRLTASPYAGDYRLCWSGGCKMLNDLAGLTGYTGAVELIPCRVAR